MSENTSPLQNVGGLLFFSEIPRSKGKSEVGEKKFSFFVDGGLVGVSRSMYVKSSEVRHSELPLSPDSSK